MKKHINQFISHLSGEYSKNTIRNYQDALDRFSQFVGEKDITQITKKNLTDYRSFVSKEDISNKTKNLRLIPVRKFIEWLEKNDIAVLSTVTLELFRIKKGEPLKLITQDEIDKYLKQTGRHQEDLLVNFLYYTGLRVAELLHLRCRDVENDEFVIYGKGNRPRTVFVCESLRQLLDTHCQSNSCVYDERTPLFPLTAVTAQRMVKSRGEKLGLSQKMTPHVLRHLYASQLYKKGVDIRTLQELLGHSSITTTQIYTHVTIDQMREAVKKLT